MKQVTSTGYSVDDAVESALTELSATREQVDIVVLDEGKKGLFRVFGSKPAIVKVTVKNDPIHDASEFLKNVIDKMGVNVNIDIQKKQNEVTFKLSGEKIALLIGKRGQTLNSLQYLTHLVANRNADQYYSIIVDAENYRERRKETLENLAQRLAHKVLKTNRQVVLEPMPSYERKVIHTALYNKKGIQTYSSGSEPNRHVVITPSKK